MKKTKDSKMDFKRLDAMTDEDIARQIAGDPDAAPELTEDFFKRGVWVKPLSKKASELSETTE